MLTGSLIQAVLLAESPNGLDVCSLCGDPAMPMRQYCGPDKCLNPPKPSEEVEIKGYGSTPTNDNLVVKRDADLDMPKSELDPPPHKNPGEGLPDQTTRLKEPGVGTITQTDIIN